MAIRKREKQWKTFYLSSVGKVRTHNEDSLVVIQRPFFTLLAVCDGMGGHKKGEVASQIAISTIQEHFSSIDKEISAWKAKVLLKKILQDANDRILTKSKSDKAHEGMGTTAVVAIAMKEKTVIANIGDSRCYETKSNRKTIKQLTVDQSVVEILYEKGKIKKSEMRKHPSKNIITNALGVHEKLKVVIKEFDTDYEDLLLCSDGLTNEVPDNQLTSILKRDMSLESKGVTLINRANDNGGKDNISVALLEIK